MMMQQLLKQQLDLMQTRKGRRIAMRLSGQLGGHHVINDFRDRELDWRGSGSFDVMNLIRSSYS
jgi:hypothetical protein